MAVADILIFECGMPIHDVVDMPIDNLMFWADRFIKHKEK